MPKDWGLLTPQDRIDAYESCKAFGVENNLDNLPYTHLKNGCVKWSSVLMMLWMGLEVGEAKKDLTTTEEG